MKRDDSTRSGVPSCLDSVSVKGNELLSVVKTLAPKQNYLKNDKV